MADLTNGTEVQSFDCQSPFSPSSSGNELKDGNENEFRRFQCALPFNDTVVLDVDTEVLDNLNFDENMRTQSADEYEEEIVPDSDDEGRIHRPEVVGAVKGLSFDENGRRVRGDALDLEKRRLSAPCQLDKDGGVAIEHCIAGYSQRVSSSVHAHSLQASGLAAHSMTYKGNDNGSNFIQTDTQSQKQLVLKDDGILRVEDQFLVDTNLKEVGQDHDNSECNRGMKVTLNGNKESLSKIESSDGKTDLSKPLACDQESARLNNIGSQEAGESSQAKALDFVDRFLSCNIVDLSQGIDPGKIVKEKSPPVLSAKGPRTLAKRINLRTSTRKMETFEWVDSHQEGGGDFFGKRMEALLNCRGHGQRSVTMPQKVSHLVNKGGGNSSNVHEEKEDLQNLHKEIMGSSHPTSRFVVHNSKEIGKIDQVSEMKIERNFIKKLGERLDSESSVQQLEANGIGKDTQDMFDVFNTQMAAEVMEALLYAPPANCSTDDVYRGEKNTLEDSLRGVTKDEASSEHPSFQKRASSGFVGIARKSKKIKRHADKLSRETSSSAQKHSKQVKELDSELKVRTKEKNPKSLAENNLNCRNLANVSETSGSRSSKPVEQRKAEAAVDRDNIKEVKKYLSSSIIVEHTSLGKGLSEGEGRFFSPIAGRTRQSMSVRTLNRNKGPDNSGEGMGDDTEIRVLKHRTKGTGSGANAFEVLSVRGKCTKLSSNTSAEARNTKLSQPEQTGVGVAASTSCLKLDIWRSYPRRKRTHRNMTGHSNVVRSLYTAFTDVDGAEGNDRSVKRTKRSKHSTKTTCVNLGTKRKTWSYFDNPGSADVSNCEMAVMDKRMFLLDMVSAKPSPQSGKLGDMDSTLSADCAGRNLKFEVLSNVEVKQSGSERTTVDSTKASNAASPGYMGYGYHKLPCNKNLPRSSLIKELIQLGVPELIPNFSSKDLRRRRDMANIRVLFSQHLDDDLIKHQKKILARLGISVASSSSDATHFVTDKFVRTRNMLEAIALSKPVVTHLWLESCGQVSCFIDEKNYILRDARKEKEIGFSMPVSLARASQHPLLKGQRVFITPNIKPSKEMIASLIKAVHGQAVEKIQKSEMKDEKIPDDLLILSCEEDYAICVPFLDEGAAVYSSELILNGIVIQKLEYERNRLFRNHVTRKYSGKRSRKDGNVSLPVTKCK